MKKETIRLAIMQQRIKHNMNQSQLAEVLGVSQRSVSLWENGEVVPRNTTCIKLAQAFDLPIDYFMIEDENEEEPKEADSEKNAAPAQSPELSDAIQTLIKHYGDMETAVNHLKGMKFSK